MVCTKKSYILYQLEMIMKHYDLRIRKRRVYRQPRVVYSLNKIIIYGENLKKKT